MVTLLVVIRALAGAIALILPSIWVAHRMRGRFGGDPETAAVSEVLLGLGWGFGVLPAIVYSIHLFAGLTVTLELLVAVSSLHALPAGLLWLRDRRRRHHGHSYAAPDLPVILLAGAAVALVFLLRFDASVRSEGLSPALQAAYSATGHLDGAVVPPGKALGETALLSTFTAAFGPLGPRVAYAACGLLLALGGYLLGAAAGWPWGWLGMILLPMNPYVLGQPQATGAFLALAWSAPILPALVQRAALGPVAWLTVGLLMGGVVSTSHLMLLVVFAPLAAACRGARPGLAVPTFLLGVAAGLAPTIAHGHLAHGTWLRVEGLGRFGAHAYALGPLELSWDGLLGWPLHDTFVRAPHHPLPMLLAWPLHVLDHLGTILAGAAVTGFVVAWIDRASENVGWLLWFAPPALALGLVEGVDRAADLAVGLVVLPPIIAWVLAAARWSQRFPGRVLGGLLGAVAALSLGVWAVPDTAGAADDRYYMAATEAPRETEAYVVQSGRAATDIGPLPDGGRVSDHGVFISRGHLDELVRDALLLAPGLVERPWGWRRGESRPAGAAAFMELDLRDPPFGRMDIMRATPEAGVLDLTQSGLHVATGLKVSWDPRPLGLYATHRRNVTTLMLFFLERTEVARPCTCDAEPQPGSVGCAARCRLFALLAGLGPGWTEEAEPPFQMAIVEGARLRMRVPTGGLGVALAINPVADDALLWKVSISTTEARIDRPIRVWHD